VEVSNADRVVFPEDGFTKGQVVDYYASVAPSLLDFVSGRALTVERYPKGIGEEGFMQKNVPEHLPDDLIGRHEVPKQGGTTVYPVVTSAEGVLAFANLGVITFHIPPSKVADERYPDWAIWDLDPPAGRFDLVREAARALREVLDGFGVVTGLMTSGSNGYHLRSVLEPSTDADVVAHAVRSLSALAEAAHPELLTLAFKKKERGDRVFVDWLRNAPYSTSVSPWSLRPRTGAPVATPIDWDELDRVDPDGVHMMEAASRTGADPWNGLDPQDMGEIVPTIEDALAAEGIELAPFDRFRS
jgi:bifunctional non-homologous end joining protein LigD